MGLLSVLLTWTPGKSPLWDLSWPELNSNPDSPWLVLMQRASWKTSYKHKWVVNNRDKKTDHCRLKRSSISPSVYSTNRQKHNIYATICFFSLFSALILLNEEMDDLNATLATAWKLWPTPNLCCLRKMQKTPQALDFVIFVGNLGFIDFLISKLIWHQGFFLLDPQYHNETIRVAGSQQLNT